jgi:hypothetical protein
MPAVDSVYAPPRANSLAIANNGYTTPPQSSKDTPLLLELILMGLIVIGLALPESKLI